MVRVPGFKRNLWWAWEFLSLGKAEGLGKFPEFFGGRDSIKGIFRNGRLVPLEGPRRVPIGSKGPVEGPTGKLEVNPGNQGEGSGVGFWGKLGPKEFLDPRNFPQGSRNFRGPFLPGAPREFGFLSFFNFRVLPLIIFP